jgi:hypothetical protein
MRPPIDACAEISLGCPIKDATADPIDAELMLAEPHDRAIAGKGVPSARLAKVRVS